MVARNKMVINGTIAGGLEAWSCSLDFILDGGVTVDSQVGLQTWADLAAAALSAGEVSYPTITARMGAFVDAREVILYTYPATGPATRQASAAAAWSGSGTIRCPFPTSICVSKRTERAGRSGRGRMYWPALAASMNSDGTYVTGTDLADEFAQLIVDLGNTDGVSTAIAVVASLTLNEVSPITSVRVGNVLDSQRGRRDNLNEIYQEAVIIP